MNFDSHIFLVCLFLSTSVSLIIFFSPFSADASASHRSIEPQQIHKGKIPRIGGLAIFLALLITVLVLKEDWMVLLQLLIIAAAPALVVGLAEDFTGLVSAKFRLLISLVSGFLFCMLTGYRITDVSLDFMVALLNVPLVSFLLTTLAVATMINAMNIIDGLNGLAAGSTILMVLALGILAIASGDIEILFICWMIIPSVLGFLVWNFPFGKIFLGDGGAYFLGALLAGLAVLLPERNSDVSPFASLLIIAYPIYELIRSTCRRALAPGALVFEPDQRHLHRVLYDWVGYNKSMTPMFQNSLSSFAMLMLPLACSTWAVFFYKDTIWLALGFCFFIVFYEILFAKLSNRQTAR